MAYFSWTDDLSVGNVFIDADHRKMIGIINHLHDAMREQRGDEVLGKVLFDLIVYTRGHFMREEDYMSAIGYPGLEAHRHEHELLLWKVGVQYDKFKAGKTNTAIEVANFLHAWLLEHIQESDLALAAAMAAWKKRNTPVASPSWTVRQLAERKE